MCAAPKGLRPLSLAPANFGPYDLDRTVLKRILIFCLLASPVFAGVAQHASAYDVEAENQMVALINKERAERGLQPVRIDERLIQAARLHSETMISHHELSHRLPNEPELRDRVAVTGIDFSMAGENVAYDANAQHAHVEFMHSPGHRANILQSKFNAVGIGIVHQGNLIWVTEDFAQRLSTTSASEAAITVMRKYSELRKKEGTPAAHEKTLPELGKIACNMAAKDKLDTHSARGLANMRGVLAWTAVDPAKLPEQVKQLADDKLAKNYSVGVCFASSDSYPNKVFWFILAAYQ